MSLYETLGERIRKFRERDGLSQEQLAKKIGEAANTISRWETATYKPSLDDLDRLSRAFKDVSIVDLFPEERLPSDQSAGALLRSAKALDRDDLVELRRYADYLRARNAITPGRSGKKRAKGT